MKDFLKFTPNAIIIAFLAAAMQFLDMSSTFGGVQYFYGWVGFAAWACYFLNGCSIKGGTKVVGCWIAGVIASILIYELGGALFGPEGARHMSPKVAYPVAVGIIAFLVILFEKVPALDFIPAWFVGAACFFGLTNHANGGAWDLNKTVAPILISCIAGQFFGYVTVYLRTAYTNSVTEETADEVTEEPKTAEA